MGNFERRFVSFVIALLYQLNNTHTVVTLIRNYSNTHISIPDVNMLQRNTNLLMDFYVKPAKRREILRYGSNRPKYHNNNIQHDQFVCLRRMCSDNSFFTETVACLKSYWKSERNLYQFLKMPISEPLHSTATSFLNQPIIKNARRTRTLP